MLDAIATLCTTILSALSRVGSWLLTLNGLLVSALATVVAIIAGIFGNWSITSYITNFIGYVSSAVSSVSGYISTDGPCAFILAFFACDSLASWFVVAFASTIGVVVFLFVTVFLLVLPLIFAVVVFRGILKLIQVCSAGFIDV